MHEFHCDISPMWSVGVLPHAVALILFGIVMQVWGNRRNVWLSIYYSGGKKGTFVVKLTKLDFRLVRTLINNENSGLEDAGLLTTWSQTDVLFLLQFITFSLVFNSRHISFSTVSVMHSCQVKVLLWPSMWKLVNVSREEEKSVSPVKRSQTLRSPATSWAAAGT